MKLSSAELTEMVYKIAYYFTYESMGMTTSIVNSDLQKREMIVAFKDVTYGVFQPTPFSVLEQVVKFAGINRGMKVFDFGCGDGIVARILASKGVYVNGIEEDNDIYAMAVCVPTHFPKAINMLLAENHAEEMRENVLSQIKETEKRLHLIHADAFTSHIDFSTFDLVYLYYPEPVGKVEQNNYNIKLNQLLSHRITGLNKGSKLIILRQGAKEPIRFKNLELIGDSLAIPSETADASHIRDSDLRKRGVKDLLTVYMYKYL